MTDDTEPTTAADVVPKRKPTAADARQDRLAARLRENLRKRKDQARQRDEDDLSRRRDEDKS